MILQFVLGVAAGMGIVIAAVEYDKRPRGRWYLYALGAGLNIGAAVLGWCTP